MNKLLLICSFFILLAGNVIAQGPSVPGQLQFAGMDLRLTESLRKELQTEVDALTRSEKYFNIKVERARQYFPIIERIFKEENVPEDIKYLVIQESALISDAVSSSDAVGFWQFKEGSGKEVGFRIDRQVDERLNIVSATRGAARYLKTNHFYFKNWIYAVLAYNTGRGGVEAHIQKKYMGAHKMD
ncbi:MAG TPA: lytic transglycosylase domain-containing protein, partial [Cyclobacteriaceae bacterium]|nr:lytic transglycosylase domain-containing protein [Cyclobacteriaceae bacterium]